jgi:hypothetical protein
VVLYRCETWVSNINGGTQTVRVFEYRLLRRIFEPKRDEVTGGAYVIQSTFCMQQPRF